MLLGIHDPLPANTSAPFPFKFIFATLPIFKLLRKLVAFGTVNVIVPVVVIGPPVKLNPNPLPDVSTFVTVPAFAIALPAVQFKLQMLIHQVMD